LGALLSRHKFLKAMNPKVLLRATEVTKVLTE